MATSWWNLGWQRPWVMRLRSGWLPETTEPLREATPSQLLERVIVSKRLAMRKTNTITNVFYMRYFLTIASDTLLVMKSQRCIDQHILVQQKHSSIILSKKSSPWKFSSYTLYQTICHNHREKQCDYLYRDQHTIAPLASLYILHCWKIMLHSNYYVCITIATKIHSASNMESSLSSRETNKVQSPETVS